MHCPTCNKPIEWNDNFPQRPFCSQRCKLIDLGAWASESNVIGGEPAPMDDGEMQFDSLDNLPTRRDRN